MALGMEVGLSPGDFVLDGDPARSPKRGRSPLTNFRPTCCGQRAGWIKMALGMEAGLSPGDFVLDGDPAPLPKRGRSPKIFGPCLLWPNRCVDQDVTWYGGRPQPTRHCIRWGSSYPLLNGHGPLFSANVRCGETAGWSKMSLGMEVGLGPGDCVRWGPSSPQKKGTPTPDKFWPMSIVAERLDLSRCHLLRSKTSAQATLC